MNWRFLPTFIGAVVFTFVVHEGAHWGAGEALGYDMWLRANSAGLAGGEYATPLHAQIVAAAGPLITLLQAALSLILIAATRAAFFFPFLFSALMMRVLATGVSLSTPNDEARVSEWLGVGMWTLPAIMISILFVLTVFGGVLLKLSWRSYLFSFVVVSVLFTAVIIGEPYLPTFNPYAS